MEKSDELDPKEENNTETTTDDVDELICDNEIFLNVITKIKSFIKKSNKKIGKRYFN